MDNYDRKMERQLMRKLDKADKEERILDVLPYGDFLEDKAVTSLMQGKDVTGDTKTPDDIAEAGSASVAQEALFAKLDDPAPSTGDESLDNLASSASSALETSALETDSDSYKVVRRYDAKSSSFLTGDQKHLSLAESASSARAKKDIARELK